MPRVRLIVSVASLVLGTSIVLVSLTAVSPVISSESSASHKRFYMDDPMMPDHVAYPLLMIADRVALEAAEPSQRIELQLEYGLRRLEYSRKLLEKGDSGLAMTTLTKSQKYILQAAQESLDVESSPEIHEKVLKVLIRYTSETKELSQAFTDSDRSVIDGLLKECEALQLRLRESLGK